MDSKKTIFYKRYSNRRLYDTSKKKYVTFHDVSGKIKEGFTVVIIDKDSQKDITTQILTQIVLQECENFFTSELLHQMIKLPHFYIKEYLESFMNLGLQFYKEFIQEFKERQNRWINIGLPINDEKARELSFEFARKFFNSFTKQ